MSAPPLARRRVSLRLPRPFSGGVRALAPARLLAALATLLALLALAAPAHAALPIEHWTTSNGVRVFFVRAAAIPMLDVEIDFDAGARRDPRPKAGLASLTASMLSRGVTGLDEAAISERFANVGAQQGGGAGDDRASLSLRTLTSQPELDTAVDMLARIVSQPTFPAKVLEREKERVEQAIREADTKPETIAQRSFGSLLYPEHPYGVEPTVESVAAIGRDDLLAFYRDNYAPARAIVAIIGDVTREQAEAIATRLTSGLPAGVAPAAMPPVQPLAAAVERRIPHPASQSHILIGQPGIARGDPDFFPLLVGNYVLGGGGFVSRLYTEVREKRGLAYSVYSYFSPQLQPGPFTVGLQTQKEQTDLALSIVRQTLTRFLAEGPTAAELQAAKDNLIGGFALRIDSNRKILDNLAVIGYYGLPLDYLDTWTGRVAAVTVEQVKDAFARRLNADRMATVIVGAGAPAAAR